MPLGIGDRLPSVFARDVLAQAFAGAVDTMYAPVIAALDCLHAYVDPALAPEDWLRWLATWVALDFAMTGEQLREAVGSAAAGMPLRGTRYALETELSRVLGTRAEIVENGAGSWSRSPDAPVPGHATPTLKVRVFATERVDQDVLRGIVERHRPAHTPLQIEVVRDRV